MRREWLQRVGTGELTLVFGGWGLGVSPFAGMTGAGDVLFVEDYTLLDDPVAEVSGYDHVALLAYSFGVASAVHWMTEHGVQPDRKVAVNGTLYPADKDRGIAPEVVEATIAGLSEQSFAGFCRRAGVKGSVPEINVTAAQAELRMIMARGNAPDVSFDRVWIADRDRIIPTKAQERAWHGQEAVVRRISAPHQPFAPEQSWQEWLA